MSFSSWVEHVTVMAPLLMSLWFWATLITALVKMTWRVFVYFPWWIFVAASIYLTLRALKNRWAGGFGAVAKVFAPFVAYIYWIAIYEDHHPWDDPTDTYLVLMAHIIMPVIMIIETFRAKNTHFTRYMQRNADFPVLYSFVVNTIVYFVYVGVYLLALPKMSDPIYTNIGFTSDEGIDALIAVTGWIVMLMVNSVIAFFTWLWRNQEAAINARLFEEETGKGTRNTYVMDSL